MGNILYQRELHHFHLLHSGRYTEPKAKFCIFVFGICRQGNRQLFVVVLQSFLTTMCKKVQPSLFISKRKRLVNSKCYTKDSFNFTSLFISLKTALFPLLSYSHSTLRNTICMLYQSSHPQIHLQPNIASSSPFKTNILSLFPTLLLRRPYRSSQDTLQIFDSQHSSSMFFFQRRNCRSLKCA